MDGTVEARIKRVKHDGWRVRSHDVMETGYFRLQQSQDQGPGSRREVGYVATGAKSVSAAVQMGDTMTDASDRPAAEPVIGYVEAKPMVFSGFYPIDADDYVDAASEALEKLQLNDAALTFEAGNFGRAWFWIPVWLPRSCSTWRLCKSVWSVSTTLILSRPSPMWSTTL